MGRRRAKTPEKPPAAPPRRRWKRRLALYVAMFFLVAGLAGWLVMRSVVLVNIIEPQLEAKLGGDVEIGVVDYQGDGRFVLRDCTLRVRDMPGLPGEVAHLEYIAVDVRMSDLVRGDVDIRVVDLGGARVRISEDANHPGEFNFMGLTPEPSDESGGESRPPSVRIDDCIVEFGEHEGEEFRSIGRRRLAGEMYPMAGSDRWYSFELGELGFDDEEDIDTGLRIKGQWDVSTNEMSVRMDGLAMDDRAYRMCPSAARLWWDRMALEGRVSEAAFHWGPDRPMSVQFAVQQVGLTLPIDTSTLWARYRDGQVETTSTRPRMRVFSGIIRLEEDRLELQELAGELISTGDDTAPGVPYRVSMVVPEIPALAWDTRAEWLDEVLNAAPFEAKFRMDDFRLKREEGRQTPFIDLPAVVAQSLSKFALTDWVLSTSVDVSRGSPDRTPEGRLAAKPVQMSGQALIREASGSYRKFAYALDNIDAYLQFDNEKVVIHYLNGRGSGDSRMRLWGEIRPPQNDASVSIHISATDVPLDDRLRAALRPQEQEAFDMLLSPDAYAGLRAHELLPTQESTAALQNDRRTLVEALAAERGMGEAASAERIASLEASIAQLGRRIEAGPFVLGGTIDLDLHIHRDEGKSKPTSTTGHIKIDSACVLYSKFPYPVWIRGGAIDWQNDRLVLIEEDGVKGLPVTTIGGGHGWVTGEILLSRVEGRRRAEPRLSFVVADDHSNNVLLAAMPLEGGAAAVDADVIGPPEPWVGRVESKAARLLRAMNIDGTLGYAGSVTTGADGKAAFDVLVTLIRATVTPGESLAPALGLARRYWPAGFAGEAVEADVRVKRDSVIIERVAGRCAGASLDGRGFVDIVGKSTEFELGFRNLPLHPDLLEVLPEDDREVARRTWDELQPRGAIDAVVQYRDSPSVRRQTAVDVQPTNVQVMASGELIDVRANGGRMYFAQDGLQFDALKVMLTGPNGSEGEVQISGAVRSGEKGLTPALTGSWSNVRFNSPIVHELVRRFAGPEQADRYTRLQPQGDFNAVFEMGMPGRPVYSVVAAPQSIGMVLNETAIALSVENGAITFTPGLVQIDSLAGTHSGGRFAVDGVVRTDGLLDVDLRLGYEGRMLSSQVQAFLPEGVRATLKAIEMEERADSRLEDARLRMGRREGDRESGWDTDFRARLVTTDASFRAGLQFTEMAGRFDLHAGRAAGAPPWATISASADHVTVLGHVLRNLHAPIELVEEGTCVKIDDLRADAQGGAVTANVTAGIGDRREYEATVKLAGVGLSEFFAMQAEAERAEGAPPSDVEPIAPPAAKLEGAPAPPEPKAGIVSSSISDPRGEIFGSITLAGRRDEPWTRYGRGMIRVPDGKLASIPLGLQLIQVLQMTVPIGGSLNSADIDFFVKGDRVVFEQALFESSVGDIAALTIAGEGEMGFTSLELDMRFHSRSGLLIVRDIVGAISDSLWTIEVKGPLWSPKARVVPALMGAKSGERTLVVDAPAERSEFRAEP